MPYSNIQPGNGPFRVGNETPSLDLSYVEREIGLRLLSHLVYSFLNPAGGRSELSELLLIFLISVSDQNAARARRLMVGR